ncbi:acyl-CoA dehydrogenase [Hwanghaeella grinnelliae]|uniref:Acyl-CoA dehydrogenase n=1 Tax=Hwanghaeella grinnelliae TaxID=2500179 RepID=A0A437QVP4_9PROT|nr:acyl-CoA dehydrogenase family protein [Hwanghaeella grinnelliae]RVU38604.1 acyl-CoA dehydrogenase [Hwanghaeella grinnelliae]
MSFIAVPTQTEAVKDLRDAVMTARIYLDRLRDQLTKHSSSGDRHLQFRRHGYAWMAAYCEAMAAVQFWSENLAEAGRFFELEQLIARASVAEYLNQLRFGVAMSQDEVVRPGDFDEPGDTTCARLADAFGQDPAIARFAQSTVVELGRRIIDASLKRQSYGDFGLDETHTLIANEFEAFSEKEILPNAHGWHEDDALIPDQVVAKLADMGVFGLTVREEFGGTGLGKLAMCIVTEELSRGFLGVGSLGTRSEIAGELIQVNGTAAQKSYYLPKICSGEILPAAVFTEPDTGSDLSRLSTRADRQSNHYIVSGNKTWITHAARSDLMTLLVRTDPNEKGHRGLTMLLADKTRGTDSDPFPDDAISGGEIPVIGYRGLKEYDLAFDGFKVPVDAALGGLEGQGFKQLMNTFESARIQTAARALGVARNALDFGFDYAGTRMQFGNPILSYERVYGKLARILVESMAVRQLTYMAARKKDQGGRSDVEAGMAKLLAARLAWSAADNVLQIHGGIGFAAETPISRLLCDARILSIFEGAAEIQAEIIARGLLGR